MKHLLTAIACCLAVAGSAQTPYNPDSNGDNFIGSHDLLDFLPLYDSSFAAELDEPVIVFATELDTLRFMNFDSVWFLSTNWVDDPEDIPVLHVPDEVDVILHGPRNEDRVYLLSSNSLNYRNVFVETNCLLCRPIGDSLLIGGAVNPIGCSDGVPCEPWEEEVYEFYPTGFHLARSFAYGGKWYKVE